MRATKAKPIGSNRELARHVNRSHATVNRWVKDDRWPFGPAPWSLRVAADALEWAEVHLQENRAADPEPDPVGAEILLAAFPELHDPQYRRELDAHLTTIDAPPPDADAARQRYAARLRQQADEFERTVTESE